MRVLHIGKFYPPHPGGIERASADLCTALAARDVDVAMLAHAPPGASTTQTLDVDGVAVTLAACHGQWLYAPLSPSFPFLLHRVLREFKPNLIHLHVPNTSAFWALLTPAARRLPWIVHWHADVPLDIRRPAVRAMYRLYRPFEQSLLRRARAVIASSTPYLDSSAALAPWRDKVQVIPYGLNASATQDSDSQAHATSVVGKVENAANDKNGASALWPANGMRLLAVGRLSYYKGFDVLLRALSLAPELSLLLIGRGECESALHALARELSIESRVRFTGHVDDATLAQAYANADVFCLPSIERTEAFGIVLLEAMRAQLPIVASAISGSGVGYVVVDGVTGLLTPPGDAAALAQALRELAGDDTLRKRFGSAGYARWQNEFTLERSVDQILSLYRSAT